jgi:hypothetical protein
LSIVSTCCASVSSVAELKTERPSGKHSASSGESGPNAATTAPWTLATSLRSASRKACFTCTRALRIAFLVWSSVAEFSTRVSALVVAVIRAVNSPPALLAIIRAR